MPSTPGWYAPLLDALATLPPEQETAAFRFTDLAALLGRRLHRAAFRAEYWTASHTARKSWLRAGWLAFPNVDDAERMVIFMRRRERRPRGGPSGRWFRQLAALLAALPAEPQTVCWTLPEIEQRLRLRLPMSVRTPAYWHTPAIRAAWEAAGFTAQYDRRTQCVTFTRRAVEERGIPGR